MRIALSGFVRETNTFCTDRTDNRNFSQTRGERMLRTRGTQTSLGGAPGDGTHLLRSMLDTRPESACFGFIIDADVADQAHTAGVGATITVDLGGNTDALHGAPLHLTAYVKALHDGRLKMLAMFKGAPLHLGKLARLVVDGIDIIVGSRRSQTFDIAPHFGR